MKQKPVRFSDTSKVLGGVAFIGGIGAGILGLPFAIAKVGLPLGIPYIIAIGLLMMGVNLLIGEIIIRTKKNLQLAGLARTYIGKWGEGVMVFLTYTLLFAVLLIYIIGEGQALAALFGGSAYNWSVGFFVCASILVIVGMKMIQRIDILLLFLLTLIVSIIIGNGFLHIHPASLQYTNWGNFFLPYGVLIFSFHATAAVPEAFDVVEKKSALFRRAIIASGVFNIIVYIFFAIATVGVLGVDTTAIATIGLGEKIGQHILVFGNIFAVIAMGLSYLNCASTIRDSLTWDFKINPALGATIACLIPFGLFVWGMRGFIETIDVVGGVFMSVELLLLLYIYWKVEHLKRKSPDYMVHHAIWLFILLILAFSVGTVYSVVKLF